MALTTRSISKEPQGNDEDPRGEIRYDPKGLGYWYSFKNGSKAEVKVNTDLPTEDPVVSDNPVEPILNKVKRRFKK